MSKAFCQEWNFGLHINPIITAPFGTKNRIAGGDTSIKFPTFDPHNFGINIGLDIKWAHPKWAVKTGIYLLERDFVVFTPSANYFSYSNSYEIPLEYHRLLWTHDKKLKYKVNLVLGAGYESNYVYGSGISGSNYRYYDNIKFLGDQIGYSRRFYHLLTGFNISAVIHKFGLIEYGIVLHYPLKTIPEQDFIFTVSKYVNGVLVTEPAAEFRPKLAWLDFRLCYYFLNLNRHGKRIKYRKI
jgi:hypothetical protein